jgi:RNA polymerase sigma-70 factor (ECF subfamily)
LVVRFCLQESRRARRTGVREIQIDETIPVSSNPYADADLRDQLDRALRTLSVEHRTVVVLHHYSGLSLVDIAAIVGVPYGTARSRLHHARKALRAAIEAGDRSPAIGGQPA